ncbi:oxidase [Lithospermum erythrorhizon]|uniref:Oxidase n=1 Tax=Lithospermum erythrorhizon TaxID=34254 RepID=A0AAV3PK20_LITER
MAAADTPVTPSLSQEYLLPENDEKLDVSAKPVDESPTNAAASNEPSVQEIGEKPIVESSDAPANDSPNEVAATEETSGDQDPTDETPEVKLETAPADFRFPTTNQTRHCFTRYIEYHRCVAAKGEGAQECDKFAKYYRALCPGEWVDRWNEQRENGTFPGPL